MPTKKRNPTDGTIRNVKASKKRDDKLALEVKKLRKEFKEAIRIVYKNISGLRIDVDGAWNKAETLEQQFNKKFKK